MLRKRVPGTRISMLALAAVTGRRVPLGGLR